MDKRKQSEQSVAAECMKKPPAVSCRGFFHIVRRSGSEVTLSANVERHRRLVRELVGPGGQAASGCPERPGDARPLLIQRGPEDFAGERQVTNRSPGRLEAELVDVEVRI